MLGKSRIQYIVLNRLIESLVRQGCGRGVGRFKVSTMVFVIIYTIYFIDLVYILTEGRVGSNQYS